MASVWTVRQEGRSRSDAGPPYHPKECQATFTAGVAVAVRWIADSFVDAFTQTRDPVAASAPALPCSVSATADAATSWIPSSRDTLTGRRTARRYSGPRS